MIIGTCQVELHIPNNHSLKGKRKVIKSIKDRVRARFNVSICGDRSPGGMAKGHPGNRLHQQRGGPGRSDLSKVVNLIETSPDAALIDYQTEILR